MGSVCSCFHVVDIGENVNSNSSNCFVQNLLNKYGALFSRGETHAALLSVQGAASLTSTVAPENTPFDTNRSPARPSPHDSNSGYSPLQHDGVVTRHEKGTGHLQHDGCRSESSVLLLSAKLKSGIGYVYSSPEDEDVCPTCLEEYTPENPKIVAQCSHHFHLGCIYEWMERSERCPVCSKVMIFDERT